MKVRVDHRLDLRSGGAAFEARNHLLALDERERRHLGNAKSLGHVGTLIDVDPPDTQRGAFLPRDVCEQALHPPGGAGAARSEEDEQGAILGH